MDSRWINVTLIYLGLFAVIGFAISVTESAWPLLGLIFAPQFKIESDTNIKKEKDHT